MTRSIIAGYDPRRKDDAPIRFALEAARIGGARVIVAAVAAEVPVLPISAGQSLDYGIRQVDGDLIADCTEPLSDVAAELRDHGLAADCIQVRGTSAPKALHVLAEQEGAVLLVVGARRGGKVLGSTATALMHGSPCPVAVVPSSWTDERRLQEIGVAYTDSDEARAALHGAHALARRAGARLRVISVIVDTPTMLLQTGTYIAGQFGPDLEDIEGERKLRAERHLREQVASLGDDVPVDIDVMVGDPPELLVEVSQHLDLLVMGARGYGPVRAVLLGSVSRRVTAEAHCPVIVLPRGVKAPLEALVGDAEVRAGSR